jgi:two-component system sensor histidine kinase KdpD
MFLAAEESGYRPALALPLASPLRTRGVLLVFGEHAEQVCAAERRPLLDAVASLTAIVVERLHYGEVLQEVTLRMESERLRSALLSAVSHDLRTPLTVLVGMADALTLGRPALPAAALESAVAIREQALRLSELVHKLLDMARLQTGKLVLNKEWQPLEEVVGSSLKAMAGLLGEREIRVELAPDLPPLEFDAVLLERVFCNLLENTAKYAPQGAIVIAAQVAGETVEVSVADAGPGLPANLGDSAFEPFERGSHSAAGVGLGLAICRAIVEVHGGSIRAESRAEGGTRHGIHAAAGHAAGAGGRSR